MKKYFHITKFMFFLFLTFMSFGQGVILSYDAPILPNGATFPSTFNNPGLSRSTIIRGVGLRLPDNRRLFRMFAASGFTELRNDAFRDGDYFEFEIEPTAGNQVSLSGLRAKFRRNRQGPNQFLWQYKLNNDCVFTDIGNVIEYNVIGDLPESDDPNGNFQPELDLSSVSRLQTVSFPDKITIRLYAWGTRDVSVDAPETFGLGRNPTSENDVIITGTVEPSTGGVPDILPPTVWNGRNWTNGEPTIENGVRDVIIRADYDTGLNSPGNIVACNLIIGETGDLRVSNQSYVEVFNDVTVRGELSVDTQGNFVQRNDSGTFNLGNSSGEATVKKESSIKKEWFHYTYWSSPVKNFTVGKAFEGVDNNRRFWFNGENYIDEDGDYADDNADDWTIIQSNETLQPAVGYAVTSPRSGAFPRRDIVNFKGAFNTGVINTNVFYNSKSITGSWNLIGNPYPGSFDFDLFYAENSDLIDGVAYVWTQSLPLAENTGDNKNSGNNFFNFNRDDYAMYNVGVGGIVGANNIKPTKFIPSGQSFFLQGLKNGQITFNNSMRVTDIQSNTQFFKVARKRKSKELENRIWINLTSKNTIFNQILIGYVNEATNDRDRLLFDVPRISSNGYASIYSKIRGSNTKFAIQGRHIDSIKHQDVVGIGFNTIYEDTARFFSLSIDKATGGFLDANNVYLKDNLLGVTHNLSLGSYNFTSEAGEFDNRFQLFFKEDINKEQVLTKTTVDNFTISNLGNHYIDFKTNSTVGIANIDIYNVLGRLLYSHKGDGKPIEELHLPNVKDVLYIVKVELSDGTIISKKAIK